jgi:hypothetical protein
MGSQAKVVKSSPWTPRTYRSRTWKRQKSLCSMPRTFQTRSPTSPTRGGCALYAWLSSKPKNSGETIRISGHAQPETHQRNRKRSQKRNIVAQRDIVARAEPSIIAKGIMTSMNLALDSVRWDRGGRARRDGIYSNLQATRDPQPCRVQSRPTLGS